MTAFWLYLAAAVCGAVGVFSSGWACAAWVIACAGLLILAERRDRADRSRGWPRDRDDPWISPRRNSDN